MQVACKQRTARAEGDKKIAKLFCCAGLGYMFVSSVINDPVVDF
jgi:hypothetical protein